MRKPAERQEPAPKLRGELALIRRIQSLAGRSGSSKDVLLGIGDDCAILRTHPGEDLVVTTDFTLEGRHFRRDWHPAASAGHRTLARGLSDLAAMGARPVAAFLSLALPRALARETAWVNAYLEGLLALAARVGVPLAGGDTAEGPGDALLADIVLLGAVPHGKALRRDRAQPGDRLFVTGTLGGSAAELASLPHKHRQRTSAHPQLFPEPRLATGQALRRRGLATAALDLSDGLSTDLLHLCEASGLRAELDLERLPLHPLLAGKPANEALHLALHGGEDYELLFTARRSQRIPKTLAGIALTEIGRMFPVERGRPRLLTLDAADRQRALKPAGWEHLR